MNMNPFYTSHRIGQPILKRSALGNHVQIFQHSGRPLEKMQGYFITIVVENVNFN